MATSTETMTRQFSEVELRIKKLTVQLNPDKQGFFKDFFEGRKFELKLFSVISDGVPDNTFHTELGIFSVDSNGSIKFGPNGYVLYRNKAGQIPRYLDCHLTVVEDDSDIRSMAQLMSKIRRTDGFKELTQLLLEAQVNSVIGIGLDVAKEILGLGLSILENNGDDLLMRQYFSFNYNIDGYHGNFQFDSPEVKVTLELITA